MYLSGSCEGSSSGDLTTWGAGAVSRRTETTRFHDVSWLGMRRIEIGLDSESS